MASPQLHEIAVDRDDTEPESDLARRAFLALRGYSDDGLYDLIGLLRSSEPLPMWLRSELADALDAGTKDGTRLTFHGGDRNRGVHAGIKSRRAWMDIGEWIDTQVAEGSKRKDAIEAASAKFYASYEKCDKALTYYRRVQNWIKSDRSKSLIGLLGEREASEIFHMNHHGGTPLDRGKP